MTECIRHYKELCTSNFILLSFRLNCRAGPILNLTWSDVKTMKKTGYLETDRHKTGRYCDVTVRIESDQQKWLKRLKSRFVKEYRTEPNFVFASPTNKVEHSMAKNIKSVLSQLFDKDYCKDFYATAVRKMWDTHFHNRKKFKDSVFNSHLQQTGHTANTALHSYVVPAERSEAIQVYIDELSKLQDLSIEDEVTVQLETTISTPKVKSGCKPPKSVDATPCSSIHSPVPTMRNPRQRDNRRDQSQKQPSSLQRKKMTTLTMIALSHLKAKKKTRSKKSFQISQLLPNRANNLSPSVKGRSVFALSKHSAKHNRPMNWLKHLNYSIMLIVV